MYIIQYFTQLLYAAVQIFIIAEFMFVKTTVNKQFTLAKTLFLEMVIAFDECLERILF